MGLLDKSHVVTPEILKRLDDQSPIDGGCGKPALLWTAYNGEVRVYHNETRGPLCQPCSERLATLLADVVNPLPKELELVEGHATEVKKRVERIQKVLGDTWNDARVVEGGCGKAAVRWRQQYGQHYVYHDAGQEWCEACSEALTKQMQPTITKPATQAMADSARERQLQGIINGVIERCRQQANSERATPGWKLWWNTWADRLETALKEANK